MSGPETRAGCARVRGRVIELADGGLAPLEAARDRGHLEACAGCAGELAEHERRLALVRAALLGTSAAEVDALAAAVRARLPASRPRARPSRALVAAAAALLALLAGLALGDARAPRGIDLGELARLEVALAPLPSWSDVLDGLARLARRVS